MISQEIEFTITPDGKISAKVVGVQGESCVGMLDVLDNLGTVTAEAHTADFYLADDEQGVVQQVTAR